MMSQHDDEPRDPQAAQAKYTPFMPGGPRKAHRAERRAKDQVRARARRRMERATIRRHQAGRRTGLPLPGLGRGRHDGVGGSGGRDGHRGVGPPRATGGVGVGGPDR